MKYILVCTLLISFLSVGIFFTVHNQILPIQEESTLCCNIDCEETIDIVDPEDEGDNPGNEDSTGSDPGNIPGFGLGDEEGGDDGSP